MRYKKALAFIIKPSFKFKGVKNKVKSILKIVFYLRNKN